MEPKKTTKEKVVEFGKKYGVYIGVVIVSTAVGVVLGRQARALYHQGELDGVNRLLANGTVMWSDGHPVVMNGKLISGKLPWEGSAVLNGANRTIANAAEVMHKMKP